ncbi:FAD:protein FMN transferase [Helicovermis profundi]
MLTIIIFATSCTSNPKDNYITRSNLELDTLVTITVYNTNDQTILDDIFNILSDITKKFSTDLNDSEISKINSLDKDIPLKISDEMNTVIERGLYYSKLSNGLFDISIEPLVKLWGIGSEHYKVPSQSEIKKALSNIDFNNIELKKNIITKKDTSTKIDLGGIAKGYAADEIVKYLKEKGYTKAMINLGGNVYALGEKSENTLWNIGIQNPFKDTGEYIGIVSVKDKTIVSSGINQRFFIKDGKRYHHILSPFDGYPIDNNLMSVAIIGESSIDADALSTITFEYGLEKGLDFINNLENTEAIFITKNKEVYLTTNLYNNHKFTLTDSTYKIMNK